MGKSLTLAFVVALALGGCTHLEVTPYSAATPSNRSGYAYMLDFTQYEIALKRRLLSCKAGEPPKVKVEATITPSLVADGEQVYVIDPRSLISAFKTSEVNIDYKDGRLVGFNASTVDRTGEVIASAAVTIGKVATLAAGIPIPVAQDGRARQYCSADAISRLALIEKGKGPITAATVQLDEARAQLSTLTAQYSAKPSEKLRVAVAAKAKSVKAGQDALDKVVEASAEAQEWLTESQTFRWPERSTAFHGEPGHALRPATIGKWFDAAAVRGGLLADAPVALTGGRLLRNGGPTGNASLLGLTDAEFARAFPGLPEGTDVSGCPAIGAACEQYEAMVSRRVKPGFDRLIASPVSLHIVPTGSYGSETASQPRGDARDGLRYRVPAAGALFICEGDQRCQENGTESEAIGIFAGPVAQLGTVFNIPFSSPAFASGSVSASFDDQGRLLKAGLKRDSAAASGVATAAGAVVDQATAFARARQEAPVGEFALETRIAKAQKDRDDARAALSRSPTQQLLDQAALDEAQKKANEARAALTVDRAQDLTTQLQVARLEADLAEQQRRAQADPQAGMLAVKAAYDAQTGVTNARRASIEAEAALTAAERSFAAASAGP